MFVKQRVHTAIRVAVVLAIATLLLAISHSSVAGAETANTLKVSPVRTDTVVEAGATKTVQTTVTNLTNAPITVRPTVNDFVSGDERGTPALILAEDEFAPSHSLKRFLSPIADVTIPAGQAKTINVIVNVPSNAKPGGYFGAVRFSPTVGDSGGQVNLSPSVASLILLTVPGPVTEKLEITRFDIQRDGAPAAHFLSSEGLTATVRFKNDGDVQLGPFGKVSVKQGDKVVYEADFNNKDQRDMILPGGARIWDIPLEDIGEFGQYTVSATFTYGQKNQTIEVTKSFWVIPPVAIIAVGVALLVLIGAIVGFILYRRNSRHKRRMMRSHGHHRR